MTGRDAKRIVARMVIIVFMVGIFLALAGVCFCMIQSEQRAELTTRMDMQELHYDADGDLILLQAGAGLIGVYPVLSPIRHIWIKPRRKMEPGLYYVSVCGDWIELWTHGTEAVYVVKMKGKDMQYFRENVQQNTPAIIY